MREKLKVKWNQTLYRWIILGCIALMIPVVSAIINFLINKDLVERKINQVNDFMLKNIQHSVDNKLDDILEMSKYYLLHEDFTLYALNVEDEELFQNRVGKCYQTMKLSGIANPDIDMMMYLREKDYIIGSKTANKTEHIYRSLISQKKMTVSLEEWREQLKQGERSGFLISENLSYANCGKENLVYATPVLYSNSREAAYLIVSMSARFIDALMEQESDIRNTFLIMDENQNIIGRYGAALDLTGADLVFADGKEYIKFKSGEEKYVGAYRNSEVTGWKYVICTPERIFMKEVVFNRNMNLLIVLIGAVIGVMAMVILQRRNYRPIQQLMDILPEQDGDGWKGADEFAAVEKNLRKLYDENRMMQDSIEKRWEYDRELGLLSAIKGRNSFFRKMSTEELLGADCRKKRFSFVTISLDMEEGNSALNLATDYNLLIFLTDNITKDLFGEEYGYLKTADDMLLVYLFLIDEDREEEWETVCREKFTWLNEFFQNRMSWDISITLGNVFDSFDHVESAYAEIEEANEQRCYMEPYGVVRVDEVSSIDFSSTGRLAYYSKRFEEVAADADFNDGKELSNELFRELENSGKPYNAILYYVLSLVNNILMVSHNLVQEKMVREDVLEDALAKIRLAESVSALKQEYYHFLRLICRAVDLDGRDSQGLSEDIIRYVKEHYKDCNMNISAIAGEIGITPRYMSKIFKEQTGMNLLNFINDVRIEHAKALLKTTGKTVDEISEEAGFTNSRTFRRNFQKAAGMTAVNYRAHRG